MVQRIFIAINLPTNIRQQLFELSEKLNFGPHRVRLVKPDKLHLTLFFLGDLDEAKTKQVCDIVDEVTQSLAPFSIDFAKLDAFPDQKNARILIIKLQRSQALQNIYQAVGQKLLLIGIKDFDQQDFVPHVTLGRFRGQARIKPLAQVDCQCPFDAKSLAVMRSDMSVKPVRYSTIHTSSFNAKNKNDNSRDQN
ncbi:RNA 2',3'-cyclic phosphodiesterase [Patescibacteria group bacterium]